MLDLFLKNNTANTNETLVFPPISSHHLNSYFVPAGDVPAQASRISPSAPTTITSHPTITIFSHGYVWSGVSYSSIESYYYPPDNGMIANRASSGNQTIVSAENSALQLDIFNNDADTAIQVSENTLFDLVWRLQALCIQTLL